MGSSNFKGEEPEPSNNAPEEPLDDISMDEPESDKPFDDEPFDADVEADEDNEPKKYIQQLSGKLGQSLRSFTQDVGMDLELEKFAINSLISATHTSQMDQEDQEDIINKIQNSGEENEPDDNEDEDDMDDGSNEMEPTGASMDASGESGSEMGGMSGGMAENNEVLPKEHKQVFVNAKLGVNESEFLSVDELDDITNNLHNDLDEDLLIKKDNDSFDDNSMNKMINDFLTKEVESEETPVIEPKTKPKTPVKVPKRSQPFRVRPNIKPAPKGNR